MNFIHRGAILGTGALPLLQFLQEELWKHELKLRAGREEVS